jgi:glycine cleavage system H lipoate-binding protein
VPEWLHYTPNHLWLDLGEDGYGHIGIDALFARALETVEEISYLTLDGTERPSAVLTAQGIDVLVAFPFRMRILGPNLYLRADPRKLMREPYSLGWLFEVRQAAGQPAGNGFKTGRQAVAWMRREAECLRRYPRPSGREDLIRMFHEFFSPMASREMEA